MTSSPPATEEKSAARSENYELRASIRVLGAVVEELSERMQLLETRASLRAAEKP